MRSPWRGWTGRLPTLLNLYSALWFQYMPGVPQLSTIYMMRRRSDALSAAQLVVVVVASIEVRVIIDIISNLGKWEQPLDVVTGMHVWQHTHVMEAGLRNIIELMGVMCSK